MVAAWPCAWSGSPRVPASYRFSPGEPRRRRVEIDSAPWIRLRSCSDEVPVNVHQAARVRAAANRRSLAFTSLTRSPKGASISTVGAEPAPPDARPGPRRLRRDVLAEELDADVLPTPKVAIGRGLRAGLRSRFARLKRARRTEDARSC